MSRQEETTKIDDRIEELNAEIEHLEVTRGEIEAADKAANKVEPPTNFVPGVEFRTTTEGELCFLAKGPMKKWSMIMYRVYTRDAEGEFSEDWYEFEELGLLPDSIHTPTYEEEDSIDWYGLFG